MCFFYKETTKMIFSWFRLRVPASHKFDRFYSENIEMLLKYNLRAFT